MQTAPFAPGSGGQVNGLKTDVPGALDPTSHNDQLGRDVMGRTIITDGVQRMTPRIQLAQMESPYRPGLEGLTTQEALRANCPLRMEHASAPPPSLRNPRIDLEPQAMEVRCKTKRHLKRTYSVGAGVKADKWILDLRRFNERREAVLQVLREGPTQERYIVEHIGGNSNDCTRTRRILSRLTSERVTASVGTDIFGSRLFALIRATPGKHTTVKVSDPGFESHAQGHLVDGVSHSPVIEVGEERDTSITSSEATSKLREAKPAADNLKVESDTTVQIKSEVGALSVDLKVKSQPENLNGNFDGYNKYGDSFGNRDQTSPLSSPGNDTIIGTDLKIESHDHDIIVSVSYSPAVKVGRERDTIKVIPTATSKLSEVKPATDSSRIASETSDQVKSTVNETGGRPQLPRMETGEESNTDSINSVAASEGDGQCQLSHSVDLSLEERNQPDKEGAHSPVIEIGREGSDSPATAPMTELNEVNLADDDPSIGLNVNNQPCLGVFLYSSLEGGRMSNECSNHSNETVLRVELDLEASFSTLQEVKPGSNLLRVEPEITEGAHSPVIEVKRKGSNSSTAPITGLNEDNLVDGDPSIGLQVNSQLCLGASHSPGWEVGKISYAYSNQAKATILDMKIELEVRDRFVRDSTILGIRHKIQRATDQFLENEWLQATQAILINSLGQHTISESVFWSKTSDAHYP